jgi:tRNA (uracil-5-)-methyltransferase TRM9
LRSYNAGVDKNIIIKLNNLNSQFYKSVAQGFSDSRNFYWQGWEKTLPFLQKLETSNKDLKVLDIGCGNGRFAKFLREKLSHDFSYLGLDNSPDLLKIARNDFKKLEAKNILFENFDLIESLLEGKKVASGNFDAVVLFGVLHHIPSFVLRQKLFSNLEKILNPNGVIIITAWQFLDNPKLASRLINPIQANLNEKDLEENDYILDWRRNQEGTPPLTKKPLRYCHLTTDEEMNELLQNLNLKITKKFKADSKTSNLNQYYILEKIKN